MPVLPAANPIYSSVAVTEEKSTVDEMDCYDDSSLQYLIAVCLDFDIA